MHSYNCSRLRGFTLIELLVVVFIITLIAIIAIPNLLKTGRVSNENRASKTLVAICQAQLRFKEAVAIDVDKNGVGEFGFFAELAGVAHLRKDEFGGTEDERGAVISPALLREPFNTVTDGVVIKDGYVFRMFLPKSDHALLVDDDFLSEALGGGGKDVRISAARAEKSFLCYAWPLEYGSTGDRAFCIDAEGEILVTENTVKRYSGTATMPSFNASLRVKNSDDVPVDQRTDGQVWVIFIR